MTDLEDFAYGRAVSGRLLLGVQLSVGEADSFHCINQERFVLGADKMEQAGLLFCCICYTKN